MRSRAFLIVFSLIVGLFDLTQAREFRAWTYQELRDSSDLIVVAQPLEVRRLDEKYILPGISHMPAQGNDSQYHALGIETRFEVLTTLKGASSQSIVLHHYRPSDSGPEINGPSLMDFDPKACDKFLLFLKKRNDGQYEGVAGQVDLILSVKKIGCM